MTNLIKEGYFFLNFSTEKIFSFGNYIDYLNKKEINDINENEETIKNKLIDDMNITCIINIEEKNEVYLKVNEFQSKNNIYKEINIKKNEIISKKEKIKEIKTWLKQEVIKGHSCFFNVINTSTEEENVQINDWIFVVIIIIALVTEINYESIINYFKEKIIYIDNIDEIIDDINKEEISETLNFLNN